MLPHKLQHLWMIGFEIFIFIFLCKNATPTVATPNPGNHDLNNPGFILQCFFTSDRKILFTYSYVKKKISLLWPRLTSRDHDSNQLESTLSKYASTAIVKAFLFK